MTAFIPAGLEPKFLSSSDEKHDDDDNDHFIDREQEEEGFELEVQQHRPPNMVTFAHHDDEDDDEERARSSVGGGRRHNNTEFEPLILTSPPINTSGMHHHHHRVNSGGNDDDDEQDPRDKLRWPVMVYSFTLVFLVEVALNVCWPAWNAMLERGICAELHPDMASMLVAGDGLDAICKEADVQGKLAMYRGWSYTVDALPSECFLLCVSCGLCRVIVRCTDGRLTDDGLVL